MSYNIRERMIESKDNRNPWIGGFDEGYVKGFNNAIDKCLKIFDEGLPTMNGVYDLYCEHNGNSYDSIKYAIDKLNLLRKEPVKRWKWTNGGVRIEAHLTEDELKSWCSIHNWSISEWYKVEGSEV